MRDIIINTKSNLQKSEIWKIHITIGINFISSKDFEEEQVIHWKSDNIELISYDSINEVVGERLESLLLRYQVDLGTSVRGSDFF